MFKASLYLSVFGIERINGKLAYDITKHNGKTRSTVLERQYNSLLTLFDLSNIQPYHQGILVFSFMGTCQNVQIFILRQFMDSFGITSRNNGDHRPLRSQSISAGMDSNSMTPDHIFDTLFTNVSVIINFHAFGVEILIKASIVYRNRKEKKRFKTYRRLITNIERVIVCSAYFCRAVKNLN